MYIIVYTLQIIFYIKLIICELRFGNPRNSLATRELQVILNNYVHNKFSISDKKKEGARRWKTPSLK